MFNNDFLLKLFARNDVIKVPMEYQSIMINAIEEELESEEEHAELYATE